MLGPCCCSVDSVSLEHGHGFATRRDAQVPSRSETRSTSPSLRRCCATSARPEDYDPRGGPAGRLVVQHPQADAADVSHAACCGRDNRSSCAACAKAQRLCGVLLLWDRLSAELWSGCSTHFTVTIPVTNGPRCAVHIGRDAPRRLAPPYGLESGAAVPSTCVSCVPVCELRSSNRPRVFLSAERTL